MSTMFRVKEDQEPLLAGRSRTPSYGTNNVSVTGSINNGDVAMATEGGEWPQKHTVPIGSLDIISTKFESLDYDICENQLLLEEERNDGLVLLAKKSLMRWVIFLFIGIFTAAIAAAIDIAIDKLSSMKYAVVKHYVDHCILKDCLYVPYFIWIGLNVLIISVGSFLVAYIEPVAGASGIPKIKCYLNGIRMPRVVRIKTLFVKVLGVVSTVAGGLAGGKEGPMIHTGAVVAAGVSQGKSTTFGFDFGIFNYFREDHEKRDFVSGGAAAGVAAAFGAPVGGVLFSLEEGCSFWNQSLTWRIFFASSVSYFTLNLLLSTYHGHPGNLTYNGLLNFGHFESINYELFELLIYSFLGAIGGCLGALYNRANHILTVFRMRYIRKRWMRVIEACLVGAVTVTAAMLMIVTISDCKPLGKDPNPYPVQMFCSDGYYSSVASLWLQNPEISVRALFHDEPGSQSMLTLLIFAIFYLTLAVWTYGLSISGGIFIPCLCVGAAWGRLFGIILGYIFPGATWVDPGKYALVGAAAQLGGVVRMTISLTVILIEATGNISFGLPLMITLLVAKWVGDCFSEGFYDIHMQLQGVPFLPWDAPPMASVISTSEVMNAPVLTLSTVETVRNIVDALGSTHNGFPVVDRPTEWQNVEKLPDEPAGKLKGLILSWQLIVLLEKKAYLKSSGEKITMDTFRNKYPRYKGIKEVPVSEDVMDLKIDLRPYMNPFPYTVQKKTSLPKVFTLFRALGLRHLVVVNDSNEVVGMVTRKDLARYKVTNHRGALGIEELMLSNAL